MNRDPEQPRHLRVVQPDEAPEHLEERPYIAGMQPQEDITQTSPEVSRVSRLVGRLKRLWEKQEPHLLAVPSPRFPKEPENTDEPEQ